jgi:hypothetical protein
MRLLFSLPLLWLSLSARGEAPACQLKAEEWRNYGRIWVDKLFAGDFREHTVTSPVQTLEACASALSVAPEVSRCLDPIRRFTKARWWNYQPGHSMGSSIPDSDYFNKVPYPDFLQIPKELTDKKFLALVEDEAETADLEKALAYVEERNAKAIDPNDKWLTFIYRSQHLATPDGTGALGRFFVYIPGKDFDRFLQFGLRSSPYEDLPNGFSVVSVQKNDPKTGKPLAAPVARLKDFWRIRNGSQITVSTRFDVKGALENCYQCHKTALLPITPDPKVFDDKRFGKTVKLVNELMGGYTDIKLHGMEADDAGPGLGPVDYAGRTGAFMASCAQGRVPDAKRLEAIRDAMNCQNCHDGSTRGLLNFPSAHVLQPHSRKTLVRQYIVDHKKMPPGHSDFTPVERQVLNDCLKEELYGQSEAQPGLLKTWLRNDSCWDSVTLNNL